MLQRPSVPSRSAQKRCHAIAVSEIPGREVESQRKKPERGNEIGPVALSWRIVIRFGRQLPQRGRLVERQQFDLSPPGDEAELRDIAR